MYIYRTSKRLSETHTAKYKLSHPIPPSQKIFRRWKAKAATRGVLCKKMFLEISQNSQENTCVRGLRPATLLRKRLWHRFLPVNFVKFLRTPLNDYWKSFRRRSSEKTFIFAVSDAILVFRFMIPWIFLHKLHLHETSYHVSIYHLKAERLSAFLIHGGSLFHIFGPMTLKLFSPNFTWLALTTSKFRFCQLRAGLSNDLTSKMFDIERGFNWCRVLKIQRQSALIFLLSLLICLNFLNDQPSCLYSHFGGTGGLVFASF